MESTLYAVFTLGCFVSPAITNVIGPRIALFVGILGYATLVLATLLYYLAVCGSWVVVIGGGLNGLGAALLWTAQVQL
jgi:hypothetical protein